MIDLHTHILPGIDDGARSLAESVRLLEDAAAEGVTVVAATPHVNARYPTSADTMEAALKLVRATIAVDGPSINLVQGGEVAHDLVFGLDRNELERFRLGGNPHYVLLEFPYEGWPADLIPAIEHLGSLSLRPVLAHPERNPEVQDLPERLAPLVADGALVQLTASSLEGRLGKRAQRTAARLLELELAHLLASDVHGSARAYGLRGALGRVAGNELRRWLTVDVPHAILGGVVPPPRPPRSQTRFNLLGPMRRRA